VFGTWWGGAFAGWEALLHVLNLAISFALITGLFAMIYKIMPRAKIAWRDVWIGAAVTALLFEIGKLLIGLYLGKSGVTSGFGAAGSLVLLLVWVYYSAQIFLLGAEFTWVYAREHGSKVQEPEPGAAPAVPTHSGNAPAHASALGAATVPASGFADESLTVTPAKTAVAPVLAEGGGIARGPGDFVAQNPFKGLGIVVTVGLVAGAVLRHIAPPAQVFSRSPIARGRRLIWRLLPLRFGKLF